MSLPSTRFVVVGLGRHAVAHYVPCLLSHPDLHLVGVCELCSEHRRAARFLSSVPVFESLARLLDAVPADAAIISTPHHLHAAQAALCLERGLDVFVDKPLALSSAQAEALIGQSRRANRLLFTAVPGRYSAVNQAFVDVIRGGRLGRVVRIELDYHRSPYPGFEQSWRNDTEKSGGGVLLDAGYHLFDTLLRFADAPVETVESWLHRQRLRVEVEASVAVKFHGGIAGNLELSLKAPTGCLLHRIEVVGTASGLTFSRIRLAGAPERKELTLLATDGARKLDVPADLSPDVAPLLEFARLRRGGTCPVNHLETDVRVLRLIERAYQHASDRNGPRTLHGLQSRLFGLEPEPILSTPIRGPAQ